MRAQSACHEQSFSICHPREREEPSFLEWRLEGKPSFLVATIAEGNHTVPVEGSKSKFYWILHSTTFVQDDVNSAI